MAGEGTRPAGSSPGAEALAAPAERWVPLAEIARPHGVRGELRARPFHQESDLLLALDDVRLRLKDGRELPAHIDGARRANDAILLRLAGVDDRDRADGLRGALVCARRSEFPAPEDGEFYACDVEGARVLGPDGAALGHVLALRSYPAADVLLVSAADGGRSWEVPLVDTVVSGVDVGAGLVTLSTLEGVERE